MNFEARWLLENQVYMLVLPAELSSRALQECDEMLVRVLDQVPHKIHLLVDMRAHKVTAQLNDARNLKHTRHPHLGRMLVVGLRINPTARFIVSLVAQIAGMPYKDFSTQEEALVYLHQMEGITIPTSGTAK